MMEHAWVLEMFVWLLASWHPELGVGYGEPCPIVFDYDHDGDVDLRDFAAFTNELSEDEFSVFSYQLSGTDR